MLIGLGFSPIHIFQSLLALTCQIRALMEPRT